MDPTRDLVPATPSGQVVAPSEALAALDAAATQYLEDNQEDNTKRSYETDWKVWRQYCGLIGIPETANTLGALVGFVKWLQDKPPTAEELTLNPEALPRPQAPSTIDRRLAGAVVGLARRGCEPSSEAKKAAREALKVYRKELTKAAVKLGRGRAPAARVGHLHRIAAVCPDTLAGRRDKALVLLGFRIAARSAELANLIVSDIEDADGHGIVVNIRFGKTGGRRVPVPFGKDPDICPVLAWREWIAAAGYGEGPAFAQIAKNDQLRRDLDGNLRPLGPRGVRGVIDRAAVRAGVSLHLTGHSLRSGLATEARRAGHDNKTIAKITGHTPTSAVLYEYFREVDEWVEAPDNIL
jgi:integrase